MQIAPGGLFRCCITSIEAGTVTTDSRCPHCKAPLKLKGDLWSWDKDQAYADEAEEF